MSKIEKNIIFNKQTNIKIIGLISLIAFILSFVLIYRHYKLAADDYSTIWLYNSYGILGNGIQSYYRWSGNFFMAIIQAAIVGTVQNQFWLYSILLFALLYISTKLAINSIFKLYRLPAGSINTFLISGFLIMTIFYSGFDITQNWFWIVGSIVYIIPIILFLLGISALIKYELTDNLAYGIIGGILILAFGNGTQNYVATALIFAFSFIIIFRIPVKKMVTNKGFMLFSFSISIGLVINLCSPGNFARIQAEKLARLHLAKPPFLNELINSQIWTAKTALSKIPYMLVGSIPILYFAKSTLSFMPKSYQTKISIVAFITATASSVIYSAAYINIGGWGVHSRSMMLIQIFIVIAFFFTLSRILYLLPQNAKYNKLFFYMSCFCILLYIYLPIRTFQIQFPVIKKYAESCDDRLKLIELIKQRDDQVKLLSLKPLAPSGILFSSEITADTANYLNHDMKMALKLPFNIRLNN